MKTVTPGTAVGHTDI